MRIARVFPSKTKWTPDDDLAYFGEPGLFRPEVDEVHVSCTFTWNIEKARRLQKSWQRFYRIVRLGGPAFGDPGGEFEPGKYLKRGMTITSRGCPRKCEFCHVPEREGELRLLEIKPGRVLQDNNILACPRDHIEKVFDMLREQKQVSFQGGLDIRLLKVWHVNLFASLPSLDSMFFAYDFPLEKHLAAVGELLHFFPRNKKRCYVLIGWRDDTPEKARERLEKVFSFGFLPFAMFYRGEGEQVKTKEWSGLQRTFARPAATKAYMKLRYAGGHIE